jgi:hypothetical protein
MTSVTAASVEELLRRWGNAGAQGCQTPFFILGIDRRDGLIAEAADGKTGEMDFDDGESFPVKVDILAVNEPRTLKAIVSASLTPGKDYTLKVVTQSSVKHSTTLLKETQEIRAEFRLTAHTAQP